MTRLTLIIPALVALLVSGPVWGETVKLGDLRERGGVHYKKFTDIPFSGTVTGLSHGKLKNGKKHGPWVRYWGDGQLMWKGTYKDGKFDGPYVRYWDNGQISAKGTYKDGMIEGPWVQFWPNGRILTKGTYKDGKREGPWVSYNQDGAVDEVRAGTYKDGKKVK